MVIVGEPQWGKIMDLPGIQGFFFFTFHTKHPHWCSKYNFYKYSQSQQTHLPIVLFIWQLVPTLNSGHCQVIAQ